MYGFVNSKHLVLQLLFSQAGESQNTPCAPAQTCPLPPMLEPFTLLWPLLASWTPTAAVRWSSRNLSNTNFANFGMTSVSVSDSNSKPCRTNVSFSTCNGVGKLHTKHVNQNVLPCTSLSTAVICSAVLLYRIPFHVTVGPPIDPDLLYLPVA